MAYRCPECKGTRFEVRRGCSVIIDGITGQEDLNSYDEADDMRPDVWICVECGEQFDEEDNDRRELEWFNPEEVKP
jgi:hypothetical protein